jgi:hypothetical protein
MLDELIGRYGRRAIVTARPWVNGEGETVRWFVEIDGIDLPDVDVRVCSRGDRMVMLLVHAGEEVELGSWSPKTAPHGPAAFERSLGELCSKE